MASPLACVQADSCAPENELLRDLLVPLVACVCCKIKSKTAKIPTISSVGRGKSFQNREPMRNEFKKRYAADFVQTRKWTGRLEIPAFMKIVS